MKIKLTLNTQKTQNAGRSVCVSVDYNFTSRLSSAKCENTSYHEVLLQHSIHRYYIFSRQQLTDKQTAYLM